MEKNKKHVQKYKCKKQLEIKHCMCCFSKNFDHFFVQIDIAQILTLQNHKRLSQKQTYDSFAPAVEHKKVLIIHLFYLEDRLLEFSD